MAKSHPSFWPKVTLSFGQKFPVSSRSFGQKPASFWAKSRLLSWPEAGFLLWPKTALRALDTKIRPYGPLLVRYGPTGLIILLYSVRQHQTPLRYATLRYATLRYAEPEAIRKLQRYSSTRYSRYSRYSRIPGIPYLRYPGIPVFPYFRVFRVFPYSRVFHVTARPASRRSPEALSKGEL